jgi:hypothetical protein
MNREKKMKKKVRMELLSQLCESQNENCDIPSALSIVADCPKPMEDDMDAIHVTYSASPPMAFDNDCDLSDSQLWFDSLEYMPAFNTSIHNLQENEVDTPEESPAENKLCGLSIAEELLLCFMIYNLSYKCKAHILMILRRHEVPGIPASVYLLEKQLPKVPRDIIQLDKGSFSYLGIAENIKFLIDYGSLLLPHELSSIKLNVKINIDGLPLYRASRIGLWTILMLVESVRYPVPLGVFCGIGKPNLVPFLENLAQELKDMMSVGFMHHSWHIKLNNCIFICDTPARAFVQSVTSHTGYFGCMWCRQKGVRIYGRMTFPNQTFECRTDEGYADLQENNQNPVICSPLLGIVPFYSSFPPDTMHLVYLGVAKSLFTFYCSSVKGFHLRSRLSRLQVCKINESISKHRLSVPCEFQRKPRTLDNLGHYKASEFRDMVLYFGPFFLKELREEYYSHFTLLHFSMYVFSCKRLQALREHAKACLRLFVYKVKELFDESFYTFNMHGLLHLADFVTYYDSADAISAFPFENYLSLLKKRIRCCNGIFQQSLTQLHKVRSLYANCVSTSLHFSNAFPDNVIISECGRIVLIEKVTGTMVSGIEMAFNKSLYRDPYDSSVLGIGYYKLSHKKVSNITACTKCICFRTDDFLYLIWPYV